MPELLHPGLVLVAGAFVVALARGAARRAAILGVPLVALFAIWQLPEGSAWTLRWLDQPLAPLVVDRLSRLFATIFALMAVAGGLYALGQRSRLEVPAAFAYAGSAIGVVFAGDWLSLFVFWEGMAIGSTLVLWSAGTRAAYAAATRYAMVHLAGGMLLFSGIAGHLAAGGGGIAALQPASVAHWLILAGVLVNAGALPFSGWLPDAYPEASWSGTVFLSAFTTKAAVYVLLRAFPGVEALVWIGLAMALYGIVWALLENDLRRLLAYSIVAQVGFMVAGVGIGSEMALNGAAAHAFTHILYKALLMMAAGSVLLATGRRKCVELGGLFRGMPLTAACVAIGAATFASLPLTAGFATKSMLTQAAAEAHLGAAWLLLVAASAATALLAGVALGPWFARPPVPAVRTAEPPASMRAAMLLIATLCVALGCWPELLYRALPHPVAYEPYTAAHVLTQLQLLLFSGLAFFLLLPRLRRTPAVTLDFDWTWRMLLPAVVRRLLRTLAALRGGAVEVAVPAWRQAQALVERERAPGGALVRSTHTGAMALWVMAMLLAWLALYILR